MPVPEMNTLKGFYHIRACDLDIDSPFLFCFIYNLDLIGQAVSEKKIFEYYVNMRVYCPGVGADKPLVSIFSEPSIFSPTDHFHQVFSFKCHLNSFPHSNAYAAYVDLVVKQVKVITGS